MWKNLIQRHNNSLFFCIAYCGVGVLWLFMIDVLLSKLEASNFFAQNIVHIKIAKDFLFILGSALMLYFLINFRWQIAQKAENDFNNLFIKNPNSMWIYEQETLQTMEVNPVACKRYGYTRAEFLKLNLFDLHPEEEHQKLLKSIERRNKDSTFSTDWVHQTKNKEKLVVNIFSHDIIHEGKKCRLITAIDISEGKQMEEKLMNQNKKLSEISWQNSHIIRRPVTNILALCTLLKEDKYESEAEKQQYIDYIFLATQELDSIIHEINTKAERV